MEGTLAPLTLCNAAQVPPPPYSYRPTVVKPDDDATDFVQRHCGCKTLGELQAETRDLYDAITARHRATKTAATIVRRKLARRQQRPRDRPKG